MSSEQSPTYGYVTLDELKSLSGLEFMSRMVKGELPWAPMCKTCNFWPAEAAHGLFAFEGEPRDEHFNPLSTIHGGWAATLLDSAMGCAVHTTLPAGKAYTTLEIKVNYVRAILPNVGRMRCEGRIIHSGGRLATAEGRLTGLDGKLYAHGLTSCMIL